MTYARAGRLSGYLLPVALLVGASLSSAGADDGEAPPQARRLPGDLLVEANEVTQAPDGWILEGSVTLSAKDARIQADRIVVRAERYVEAQGHVLLVWGGSRIAGSRLTYDLEEERGALEDAIGQMENDYFFWAKRAEKIGAEKVYVDKATVTTCTQPVPYWSFSVTSATIRLNHYARMWNVRLKAGRLPILYLPYLVWPVKRDRAAGLMLPEIHSTRNRGRVVSQELFVPLGRSADVTLLGRYYTEAGFGGGGLVRFIPNRNGKGELGGFWIRDKVSNFANRFRASYRQTQRFKNGFRMVADVNAVSDFNYFSDFETELTLVSSPTILARLEFSRSGRWTSLNVRELRRKQLFSGGDQLVQETLPEIEWRARSRRLGKTPFYLSFESSAASIRQDGIQQSFPIDANYLRTDLFPEISAPISRLTWLEVTPRVNYRVTHYTQRQRLLQNAAGATIGRDVLDESLTRTLFGSGLEIVGPKLVKIYATPKSRYSTAYKHTVEPNLTYGYLEDFERLDDILVFDEVDRFTGAGAQIAYGVRSRLFAKRPRTTAGALFGGGEAILLPSGTAGGEEGQDAVYETSVTGGGKEEEQRESVEIATFEIRQSRSFQRDLSFADLDGDGVQEESSPFSSVQLIGRVNPTQRISFDLRSSYHVLFDRISDVTFSGMMHGRNGRVRFSLVHREGLGVGFGGAAIPDDTQFRLTGGLGVFRNKLRIDVDGTIDTNPLAGQARIPDKSWRVTYATQCCTFMVEKLNRDFSALESRRDIHFRVDLRGVGKLLDHSF